MKASSSEPNFLDVFFSQEFSCAHQDEADIKWHILTKTPKDKFSSLRQQPLFHKTMFKISNAGVLMTNFIGENNLPIAVADKCGLHVCSEICSHICKKQKL